MHKKKKIKNVVFNQYTGYSKSHCYVSHVVNIAQILSKFVEHEYEHSYSF